MDTASVHSRNYFLLGAAFANVCFADERRIITNRKQRQANIYFSLVGVNKVFIWIAKFVMGGLWIKLGLRLINQFGFYGKIMPNYGTVRIMHSFQFFQLKKFSLDRNKFLIASKLTELPNFQITLQHFNLNLKPHFIYELSANKKALQTFEKAPKSRLGCKQRKLNYFQLVPLCTEQSKIH